MPVGCYRSVLGRNSLSSEGMAAFPAVYVAHGVSSGVAARTVAFPDCLLCPALELSSQLLPLVASPRSFCFAFAFAFLDTKIFVVAGKALSYWMLACTWMMRGQSGWACMWCTACVRAALPQLPARAAQGPRQCQGHAVTAGQCHYSLSQHGRGPGLRRLPGKMLAALPALEGPGAQAGLHLEMPSHHSGFASSFAASRSDHWLTCIPADIP